MISKNFTTEKYALEGRFFDPPRITMHSQIKLDITRLYLNGSLPSSLSMSDGSSADALETLSDHTAVLAMFPKVSQWSAHDFNVDVR